MERQLTCIEVPVQSEESNWHLASVAVQSHIEAKETHTYLGEVLASTVEHFLKMKESRTL
jgi:hypothetical protein